MDKLKNLFLMLNVGKWIENKVLLISNETAHLKQCITLKRKHCISELSKMRPDKNSKFSTTLINIWLFPRCFTILNQKNTLIYIKCKCLFWLFMPVSWKSNIIKIIKSVLN